MWMGDVADWGQDFRVYAVDLVGEPGLSAPSRPRLLPEAGHVLLGQSGVVLDFLRTA